MGEVVHLNCDTTLDIPAERVLQGAIDADLAQALVLGYTEDGDVYFASSFGDDAKSNWLIDKFKTFLLMNR